MRGLGVSHADGVVEADFSKFDMDTFWREMDKARWVHPLDQHGVRHHFTAIPGHVEKLVDDPYRSRFTG